VTKTHITHCNTLQHTAALVFSTGWQRPIGCLKLQVIFRKRATNYRALFREMTYKDKASHGCSPPCNVLSSTHLLRCVAVYRRVSLYVAVCCACCSVMQHVAACCSVLHDSCDAVCCSMLQCVAVCNRILMPEINSRTIRVPSVLQCVARHFCCSVLQCVAMCCCVLQCVAGFYCLRSARDLFAFPVC